MTLPFEKTWAVTGFRSDKLFSVVFTALGKFNLVKLVTPLSKASTLMGVLSFPWHETPET
eukprot:CAMPEP_0175853380 /NCGR_PEP_ID=MMETSP0107_2-20121207/26760_1 /TAXON_ID=195067 ORGANISM="Goniomonas pacifica, Strain CCMP1869" /NCGR_SAMPLE_ID=MMETSP0107_2 /ASSEMBLY_ACC=CAM_ASM_000203 /LENGTH=59 /DNA_ID=CAMNT_0017169067 /DNA_START=581 /DNA_END=763 /DNA_ORIENTATION=-